MIPLPSVVQGWHRILDNTSFIALLGAVVWAPWPLGSNRPWAVAVLALTVWVGVALAVLARWFVNPPLPSPARNRLHWLPELALTGFAAVLLLQMVPGISDSGSTLSIDPFATRRYLLATLLYAGAWALVGLVVRNTQRAQILLAAVVVAGVLQAMVAIALFASGARYELFFAAFDQGGRVTGTFVNPDHLAGYMELALSAGVGWLLCQFRHQDGPRASTWRAKVSTVLAFALSPKMLLRLLLVLMVVVLVMTHSRMGNGAFFLNLLAVGGLIAWRSKRLRRPALWMVASMAVIDVFIIGQWVGLDRVVERLQETVRASAPANESTFGPDGQGVPALGTMDLVRKPYTEQSMQERLQAPLMSLQLVAARPWLGHGGGTYVTAFPPFKKETLDGIDLLWDHAHNDYVQVACDTGLLGLALWMTVGLVSAWRAVGLLNDRRSAAERGLAVAALMALGCMGLHGLVDFNLHIPANALTLTVLLAAVWTVRGSQRGKRQMSGDGLDSSPPRTVQRRKGP